MEEQPKPLSWWMMNLDFMSREVWLWIPENTQKLTFETPCTPVGDSRDLSDEEYDNREKELEESGLKCFFCKDQLEDIEDNLKEQKPSYNQTELLQAANYYWENDAFIEIGKV